MAAPCSIDPKIHAHAWHFVVGFAVVGYDFTHVPGASEATMKDMGE